MQICVIYAGRSREDSKLLEISKALAKGLETQGHMVDVLNAYTESVSLTRYDYVLVGASSKGLFGGAPVDMLKQFLRRSGTLSGKRSFAFVTKGGLRKQKTLLGVMKVMEGEGMYLKNSDLISKPEYALALAKRLNVERNL